MIEIEKEYKRRTAGWVRRRRRKRKKGRGRERKKEERVDVKKSIDE